MAKRIDGLIVILADPLDNQKAGIHRYTRGLIEALVALELTEELLLVREKVDPTLPVKQIAIKGSRLPIWSALRRLLIIPWLIRRKSGVKVVVEPAHFGPLNLPGRIKRITIIHDLTPLLFPKWHPWFSQTLQRLFMPRILRKTDRILANSKFTKSDLHRVFPFTEGKTGVLYPGVEEHFFALQRNNEEGPFTHLEHPFFLFVGTIEPRKNLSVLLEAFYLFTLLQTNQRIDLLIVGQMGWKSMAIYDELKAHPYHNRIHLAGYVEENLLPQTYAACKALIYPSSYEGFGMPIIEALACGTPVIAAKNTSLQEAGGNVTVYFESSNPNDLAEKMAIVLKQPGSAMDKVDWARNFSWKSSARLLIEQCKDVVVD